MTNEPIHVLGVAGSLRRDSYNRSLLRAARELAPPSMAIEIWERLGEIPPYNADVEAEGDPEPVVSLKRAIESAHALLIVTPEYNYGVPGILKNAIDWASRPPGRSVLTRKPAAIMGASPGQTGTARAQLALRQSFVFTETWALLRPEVLLNRAAEKFDSHGNLTDGKTRDFVRNLLEALARWTEKLRCDDTGNRLGD
jgi:chromate reductase